MVSPFLPLSPPLPSASLSPSGPHQRTPAGHGVGRIGQVEQRVPHQDSGERRAQAKGGGGGRGKAGRGGVAYAGPYASLTIRMRIQAQTLMRKP